MTYPPDKRDADEIIFAAGPLPADPADESGRAEALEGVHHGMTLPNEEEVSVGAPGCQRCETLPRPICGPGTLHLRFPHTFTMGKILGFLARSRWKHREQEGTLSIYLPSGSIAPLLSPILDCLSSVEQRDTRAVFQPDGQLPLASDFFHIETLPEFAAQARSDWLIDILRQKRLYSVYQPILRCPRSLSDSTNPVEVYGHECLMRAIVDGAPASPGVMLDLARGAGLLFQMDLAARRAAVTGAGSHHLTQKVFINFSPNSVYNPYSCLDSTVRMIDEVGLKREQVVFEIIESERLPEMSHLKRIVKYYRENGFSVALDDVGSGYASLSVLLELRPDYVKIDMGLIQGVHADAGKAVVVRKLLETTQALNLKTVAEGIEDEADLTWVREHGADFVQGYLFAPPAPTPLLQIPSTI